MILGVGVDKRLWKRPNAARWNLVQASGSVRGAAVLADGTIVGVGTDHLLYTRATLDAKWGPPVPNSGDVLSVTVLDNGTIVGVGTDHQLYGRKNLESGWYPGLHSTEVIAVTMLSNGTLLGVGTNYRLYTRATLDAQWGPPVPNSGDVLSVTVLDNGTIVGVGMNHELYTRTTLDAEWKRIEGSGSVYAVTTLLDGSILGVGLDFQLYLCPELISRWAPIDGSGDVVAVTALPNGVIVGVGTDHLLYTRATLDAKWGPPVPHSGDVIDVTVLDDGTIVGVGTDHQLYTRATLDGRWGLPVPRSGDVIAVTVWDGTLLGVKTDHQLYTMVALGSDWVPLPKDRDVIAVTALAGGSILGVGTDQQLYSRSSLIDTWNWLPDSGDMLGVGELPDHESAPVPADWLLEFTSPDYTTSDGDGRPWGDGTAMASRARDHGVPWDRGCLVTPLIGGYTTMEAIRDAFEAAIEDANKQAADGVPAGHRGYVNISDWLFNGLRDLSTTNPWGDHRWDPAARVTKDQTALGLVLRMMSAGIVVRLMLWMPTTAQALKLRDHANEHWSVAAAIQDHARALNLKPRLGVVLLDLRTAAPLTASLHQKMITVRVGMVNVGFCGGVDLAFTRRDFGRATNKTIGVGDWQSGSTTPVPSAGWPKQNPPPAGGYPVFPCSSNGAYPEDLPANVYGKGNRYWHDQHLKLEGPIVATLDQQFAERWIIQSAVHLFDRKAWTTGGDNQVQLTSSAAINGKKVRPLPEGPPVRPTGSAVVQMWRTIPLRDERKVAPFVRGEFTVLAGVAKAVAAARELITIWDQYLWSQPLASLLAHQLTTNQSLRVLIVLPPFGTTDSANEMRLRREALQAFWKSLDADARSRVLVRDAWARIPNVGIYVHAKVQTYDDALLVAGSANMNRRSFECDAELDCAVLHRQTVRNHLAGLYAWAFGKPWTDFRAGWLTRYWQDFGSQQSPALIPDPFFTAHIGKPTTPNGVPITSDGWESRDLLDPTSIGPDLETTVCRGCSTCRDDPHAPGRLDEITYLLERCHEGNKWTYRKPNILPTAREGQEEQDEPMPHLTV